jgi:hypothetical protein
MRQSSHETLSNLHERPSGLCEFFTAHVTVSFRAKDGDMPLRQPESRLVVPDHPDGVSSAAMTFFHDGESSVRQNHDADAGLGDQNSTISPVVNHSLLEGRCQESVVEMF